MKYTLCSTEYIAFFLVSAVRSAMHSIKLHDNHLRAKRKSNTNTHNVNLHEGVGPEQRHNSTYC